MRVLVDTGVFSAAVSPRRRAAPEAAISTATVVPVSDALITRVATLRHECRTAGHPLANTIHANDLWIAATSIHVGARLATADRIFDGVPGIELVT